MRLYPRSTPIKAIDHPVHGHFDADPEHGGFDFPDELSDEVHPYHHRGKPIWETEDERQQRERTDDLGRRRDPAELYDAVGGFTDALKQMAGNLAPAAPAAPDDRDEEIARLRAQLAELEAAVVVPLPDQTTEADATPAEDGAAERPTTRRKPQAGKTAAAE